MPLKQSASKEEFLVAIGLGQPNADNRDKLFTQMWVCTQHASPINTNTQTDSSWQQEVTSYWNKHFETSSRSILRPEYASNLKVQRPYKWGHLNPAAINNAICEIWNNGGPSPRKFYDLGHSEDPKVYNWVLKWLLWHVCRYRDWRNRKGGSSSSSSGSSKGSSASTSCKYQASTLVSHTDRFDSQPAGPLLCRLKIIGPQ